MAGTARCAVLYVPRWRRRAPADDHPVSLLPAPQNTPVWGGSCRLMAVPGSGGGCPQSKPQKSPHQSGVWPWRSSIRPPEPPASAMGWSAAAAGIQQLSETQSACLVIAVEGKNPLHFLTI